MADNLAPDPTATIRQLDDRLLAVVLHLGEGVARRCRREQAALVATVERRRREGGAVTAAWLAEQSEYHAYVRAFAEAWIDFAGDTTVLIGMAAWSAASRAWVDAAALLGEPVTRKVALPDVVAAGAAIAAIGGDVARALVEELLAG